MSKAARIKGIASSTDYLKEAVLHVQKLDKDIRNVNLNKVVLGCCRGSTFLDVGCGVGNLVNLAHMKGFTATGIDIEQDLISAGKRLYPDITLRVGNVFELKKLAGTFDAIVAIDVIEHIEDDIGALRAMADKLSHDGTMVIVVPAHQWLYGERDRLLGHYRRYSRSHLRDVMHQAGLDVVHMRSWNMIGVPFYFASERIFGRPLISKVRCSDDDVAPATRLARGLLAQWVSRVENTVDGHFGLSLLCVARKARSV